MSNLLIEILPQYFYTDIYAISVTFCNSADGQPCLLLKPGVDDQQDVHIDQAEGIHSKSEKIGEVYSSGEKNWRIKYNNGDNKNVNKNT